MRNSNRFLFALALLLGLAYLIARPHVGTIYEERLTTNPGHPDSVTVDMDKYPTFAACEAEIDKANSAYAQVGMHEFHTCESRNVLMWGW
jgi:hypothetical protein